MKYVLQICKVYFTNLQAFDILFVLRIKEAPSAAATAYGASLDCVLFGRWYLSRTIHFSVYVLFGKCLLFRTKGDSELALF